jgi:phospholipase C
VSWVIPEARCSDHAHVTTNGGPGWVASIVNAVGANTACNYWKDTAIIITWDDWGGWYDHVPPQILTGIQGDYQYGFRVPLLVVSAQTMPNTVSNSVLDFGSILKFIEGNFGLATLHFADERATNRLDDFWNQPKGTFTSFTPITAPIVNPLCFPTPGSTIMAPDDD